MTSGSTGSPDLTVIFCDLVRSTPLSARFDPEDLREIVGTHHRAVADTSAAWGRTELEFAFKWVQGTTAGDGSPVRRA